MKLLLDTHAVLWWLNDDPQLGHAPRDAIADPDNVVYVSAVSVWEIVVKAGLGKLAVPSDWIAALDQESFVRLPVAWEHAYRVGRLADIHRDPFDRLLVAQALVEELILVTRDTLLRQYGVATMSL